ncbi:MAG: glycosyltransferase, partial [Fibrobacterota bacterium]|nr:nucleotide disphospho-sugar-binding domain-containing protein [Chitinispirillaceae bacterium]
KIPAILSGFLELPKSDTAEIPFAVRNFINDGDPPVYITFGSMFQIYPEESVMFFKEIIQQSKNRFIIQTKDSCTSLSNQNVLCIQHSEHSVIFSYCQAVIHHGGAGTSQAACIAGCPSFIVAFNDEQFSWGKRLYELGVAAAPMRFRNRLVKNVINFLERIAIDPVAKNASMQLSTRLMEEHGTKRAVELIEQFIENRQNKC